MSYEDDRMRRRDAVKVVNEMLAQIQKDIRNGESPRLIHG